MITHYEPGLSPSKNPVVFFNSRYSLSDMHKALGQEHVYQVWNLAKNEILFQESSLNKLSQVLDISMTTVRNYMNYHEPANFYIDNVLTEGYLTEVGQPLLSFFFFFFLFRRKRTEKNRKSKIVGQLKPIGKMQPL